jgi:histidyl-tRNA synthetase
VGLYSTGARLLEFTTIKGFKDILPGEVEVWQRVERRARRVFQSFGFQEIKLPLMEMTELFKRSIGEETDIVSTGFTRTTRCKRSL